MSIKKAWRNLGKNVIIQLDIILSGLPRNFNLTSKR